ncbi:MAG: hypothetical protein K6E50_11850 [Lachnospiraceae bacterium]|nr:hypothetical protein [Lachnospiraceae bacterium]
MRIVRISKEERRYLTRLDPWSMLDGLEFPGYFALAAVAEDPQKKRELPVGLMICNVQQDRLLIDWLFVDGLLRGRGIGEKLLCEAFLVADRLGLSVLGAYLNREYWREAVCEGEEIYFREHLFEREEKLWGEWNSDLWILSKQDYFRKKPEGVLQSDRLGELPARQAVEAFQRLAGEKEAALLCDPNLIRSYLDRDISVMLFSGAELRGALLVHALDKTIYPVCFYAAGEKEKADLLHSALQNALEKFGGGAGIRLRLFTKRCRDLLRAVLPEGRVENRLLLANVADFFRERERGPVRTERSIADLVKERAAAMEAGEELPEELLAENDRTISLKELSELPFVKGAADTEGISPVGMLEPVRLKNAMISCILLGHMGLLGKPGEVTAQVLECEVSCFGEKEGHVNALLLLRKIGELLRLDLLFASGENYKKRLILMIRHAILVAERKYPPETEVLLRIHNADAKKLSEGLLALKQGKADDDADT